MYGTARPNESSHTGAKPTIRVHCSVAIHGRFSACAAPACDSDGDAEGVAEGAAVVGELEGERLGAVVGDALGDSDGATLGAREGAALGAAEGASVGAAVGLKDGEPLLGETEGAAVGFALGAHCVTTVPHHRPDAVRAEQQINRKKQGSQRGVLGCW